MPTLSNAPSTRGLMLIVVVLTSSALTKVIMGNPLIWFDYLALIYGGLWIIALVYYSVSDWWASVNTHEKRSKQ